MKLTRVMNKAACPALADLFQKPRPESVESHFRSCVRCQGLLNAQKERLTKEAESAEGADRDKRPDATPGAVVLIEAPGTDEFLTAVIAKRGDEAITIVPVSEQVEFAGEWDMLLGRAVLGYQSMAEIWNYGSVLPEQLVETIAELPETSWLDLQTLLRTVATGGERPQNASVGPMILAGPDPRLTFQDEESERLRTYWKPTLALAGAASLGQLVSHRRQELSLSPEDLEQVTLSRGWLDDLERDTLDIPRVLNPPSLAALMKRLQIGASQRLGRIALATIETHRGQAGLQTGTAFARQRRGYRAQPPEEQSTSEYVSEFLRELEKE